MHFAQRVALRLASLATIVVFSIVPLYAGASPVPRSGVDLSAIDHTCNACDDFYQFANGTWLKNTKIPADKSTYGSFGILADQNIAVVHQILDDVVKSNPPPGSDAQKVADYYASCMDTDAIAAAKTTPLEPDLSAIDALTDLSGLPALVATLQLDGVSPFFSFSRGADFQHSTTNISNIDQGGLGLPDRDYYTKTDPKSVQLRNQYQAHVAKMFSLLGEDDATAGADAATVVSMETALAQHQLTNVQERDDKATHNKLTLDQVDARSPSFKWTAFITAANVKPTVTSVTSPAYISALSGLLASWNMSQIKTYLRWQLVNTYAYALPKAFEDAHFAFFSTTLEGITEQQPRWKRCAYSVDSGLGEALGRLYVAKAFPPQAKAAALEMVHNIESAFHDDLATLSWMTPQTRKRASTKLAAYLLKIGYPDKWRDYSKLTITRGAYATNVIAAQRFEQEREFAQIGGPVDRAEWGMTPPTVNAYYDQSVNQIVFPAGILQPPFFDATADPAVNYGAIGAVIGHESTHGFDDQGSLYDAVGNLDDQWLPADRKQFAARTECIVKQYDALSPEPGVHENGQLVVGEETADLGGLTLAYRAFEKYQSKHPRLVLDGFTPEQRFFLGWARIWRTLQRPAAIKLYAQTDVHAYDKFRVNATMSNMLAFAKAWMCSQHAPMVRPAAVRCQIW
jgi:predicted metalloendopeptidase